MTTTIQAVFHLSYAFEVGLGIDLDACDRQLDRGSRQTIKKSRRVPPHFDYRPRPLRIGESPAGLAHGDVAVSRVEIVLHDFGAAAVTYQIPVSGTSEALIRLSETLQANETFEPDARARLTALLPNLGSAVTRPRLADISEDYLVVGIEPSSLGTGIATLVRDRAPEIAAILRGTAGPLATEEIAEALTERLSFSPDDLTVIDWNAAVIVDRDPDDTRLLLEFANVQLLELRHLDTELDRALDQAYTTLAQADRGWFRSLRPPGAAFRHLGELQMDAATLFERVSSAVKLVGDQFLGRVYFSVSKRFHFEAWDRAIARKLEVLDGIYQKVGDRATARRLEMLEWIVIILIATELILALT